MAFRLLLLGRPQLLDDNGRLLAVSAKTYALVSYLVLVGRGKPMPRSALRQFLWEDSDSKTAAANLRKFLSRIVDGQTRDGYELIRSRRDHVELATTSVAIDLVEFLEMAGERSGHTDLIALCDIYRGELMEGWEFEGSDVEEWLTLQRAKLRDTFIGAVTRRLEPLDLDADKVVIRVAARRLLEVDPYNEVGHRALMRLFADDSEPVRVRDLYQSLEARLRDELGVAPDEATTDLYNSLMPASGQAHATTPRAPETTSVAVAAAPRAEDEHAADEPHILPERSGVPRLTVLPPLPIAGQDYGHQLAASLIEDVTIGLCRSKALSVVAPHTAWELSQNGKRTLLRKFRIDYAVETQLQNRGGDIWLAVKLVNAVTRTILWTEQYPFDPTQMAVQYRLLSRQVVLLLMDKIERAELGRYDSEQPATAYHLYLTGQRHLRSLDLPHVRRARRAFKLALGICPDFVPTMSGLARTLREEWLLLARGDPDLLQEAGRWASRSLEVDPDDARGYRELGVCNLYGGRFEESLEAFRQAEMRNPQYADLLVDFADALTHACEPALGLQKVSEAIKLNPLCPDYYWWIAGGSNFHLHCYADAIECMSRMRDQTPAYRLLAAAHARLGQREQAAEYVHKMKETHPDFTVSDWLAILPVRDRQYERDYEDGLREAGFD